MKGTNERNEMKRERRIKVKDDFLLFVNIFTLSLLSHLLMKCRYLGFKVNEKFTIPRSLVLCNSKVSDLPK